MFNCHSEIPSLTASVIMSHADADNISDISIDEINGFMEMMEQSANEAEYMAQFT
jgi:hypothetical protein